MHPRIYITQDTFHALTAFLQKGVSQGMFFFIYDSQNLIQNRLWTFSSAAFLPNVKNGDKIALKHKVPIIISTESNQGLLPDYTPVMFEFQAIKEFSGVAFVKEKSEAKNIIAQTNIKFEVFEKDSSTWKEIMI